MEYVIRRSTRARRVRITVQTDGTVVVVLPQRAAERHAAAAVKELTPWIERRLAEVERQRATLAERGNTVPYLGRTLTLVPEEGRRSVRQRLDVLLVPVDQEQQRHALELWYRRQAQREVSARLDAACTRAGLSYSGLTIRNQRTRWASCSAKRGMSFNWRLLLAPEDILDYVVWHEVCHLQVMDHSPRFWSLLASYLPGYEGPRAWLRRHGSTLVL